MHDLSIECQYEPICNINAHVLVHTHTRSYTYTLVLRSSGGPRVEMDRQDLHHKRRGQQSEDIVALQFVVVCGRRRLRSCLLTTSGPSSYSAQSISSPRSCLLTIAGVTKRLQCTEHFGRVHKSIDLQPFWQNWMQGPAHLTVRRNALQSVVLVVLQ